MPAKPPPTSCQRCRAELAEANARLNENQLAQDGRIQALEEAVVELRAGHRRLAADIERLGRALGLLPAAVLPSED